MRLPSHQCRALAQVSASARIRLFVLHCSLAHRHVVDRRASCVDEDQSLRAMPAYIELSAQHEAFLEHPLQAHHGIRGAAGVAFRFGFRDCQCMRVGSTWREPSGRVHWIVRFDACRRRTGSACGTWSGPRRGLGQFEGAVPESLRRWLEIAAFAEIRERPERSRRGACRRGVVARTNPGPPGRRPRV